MSSYCGRTAAWSAHINTVAFQGIEALDVDVQVSISSGLPSFTIVGLPDKAVGESRERVRSAIGAMGLALRLFRRSEPRVHTGAALRPRISGAHLRPAL